MTSKKFQCLLNLFLVQYISVHYALRSKNILKTWKNTWRYYHFTDMHHKWQSYDVWFLRYRAWRTEFSSFWTIFVFSPSYQSFEEMKKMPQDIIILQKCSINDNHIMYGSWDRESRRQIFLSFSTIFPTLTPPKNPQNQNFEKMKKAPGDIII